MTQLSKNFSLAELTVTSQSGPNIPTGYKLENLRKLAQHLQMMRDDLGVPLKINSAYRSPTINKAVGGASRSRHLEGDAADIAIGSHDRRTLVEAALRAGFRGIGLGQGFLHVDLRPNPVTWPYTANATAAWRPALGRDPVAEVNRLRGIIKPR